MSAVAYECEVAGFGSGPGVPLAELELREQGADSGWSGWGRVRQADRGPAAVLFGRAQANGLVPGSPIVVSLSPAGQGAERTWPSILTSLDVRSTSDSRLDVFVRFADPLTRLASRPLYGVFAESTPGGILAGSLARAVGTAADAGSLRIAHPSLPMLEVHERSVAQGDRIAYAIAGGEPLRTFVRRVLDGTGKRLSVRGLPSGEIRLDVTDGAGEPGGADEVAVLLVPTFGSRTAPGTLVVRGLSAVRASPSPAGTDGAKRSAGARVEAGSKWAARADAISEEPGLRAGGQVELADESVAGAREWRVLTVTHRLADRGYANECVLEAHGTSRDSEPSSRFPAPRTLTGFVREEGVRDTAAAPVDSLGRVPVRLVCDPRAVVRLPFIVPTAGRVHGFAPACCAGDRVRVRVLGPFEAEVRGALWSEALAPDEETRASAVAVRAAPGLGVAFHPAERIEELAR